MTDRRLIVLGRTGQLARSLAEQAPAAGWRLTTLGRAEIDFAEPGGAARALYAAGPACAVINAAAYTAVDRAESEEALAHSVNVETPGVLAAACAQSRTPFLHVSTDYVFDGRLGRPYMETDAPAPLNAYGRSKLAGERAVLDAGGRSLVLRTSWVWSVHGSNFVKTMVRLGAERDEIAVVDDQIGRPTEAGTLAAALLTAAASLADGRSNGGLFHFAGDGAASWADFADAVFAAAEPSWGFRPRVRPIRTAEHPTPAPRPSDTRLDCTRFAAEFGVRAAPWREAVDRIVPALLR